jgi:hypothetical protein
MWAAKYGQTCVLMLLIAAGGDVSAKDNNGSGSALQQRPHRPGARNRCSRWTALLWAAGNGHAPVIELLTAAGADVNAKNTGRWSPTLRDRREARCPVGSATIWQVDSAYVGGGKRPHTLGAAAHCRRRRHRRQDHFWVRPERDVMAMRR